MHFVQLSRIQGHYAMLPPSPSSSLFGFVGLVRPTSDSQFFPAEIGAASELDPSSPRTGDTFADLLVDASDMNGGNQLRKPKVRATSPWNGLISEQPTAADAHPKMPTFATGKDGMFRPRGSSVTHVGDQRHHRIGTDPRLPSTTFQDEVPTGSRLAMRDTETAVAELHLFDGTDATQLKGSVTRKAAESFVPQGKAEQPIAPDPTRDVPNVTTSELEAKEPSLPSAVETTADVASWPQGDVMGAKVKHVHLEAALAAGKSIVADFAPVVRHKSETVASDTRMSSEAQTLSLDESVGTAVESHATLQYQTAESDRKTSYSQTYLSPEESVDANVVALSRHSHQAVKSERMASGSQPFLLKRERMPVLPESGTLRKDLEADDRALPILNSWQPNLTRRAIVPSANMKDSTDSTTMDSQPRGQNAALAQPEATDTRPVVMRTTSQHEPHVANELKEPSDRVIAEAQIGSRDNSPSTTQRTKIADHPALQNAGKRDLIGDRNFAKSSSNGLPANASEVHTTYESRESSQILLTPRRLEVSANPNSSEPETPDRLNTFEALPVSANTGEQTQTFTSEPPSTSSRASSASLAAETFDESSYTNSLRSLNSSTSMSYARHGEASDFETRQAKRETRRNLAITEEMSGSMAAMTPRKSSQAMTRQVHQFGERQQIPRDSQQSPMAFEEPPRPSPATESFQVQPSNVADSIERSQHLIRPTTIPQSSRGVTHSSRPQAEKIQPNTEQFVSSSARQYVSNEVLISTLPAADVTDGRIFQPLDQLKAIPTQVRDAIHAADLSRAGESIEIELDPPELGRVVVQLETDGPRIVARLLVADEAVATVLEQGLSTLVESLQSADLVVDDLQIDLHDEQKGTGGHRESALFSDRRGSRTTVNDVDASMEPTVAEQDEYESPQALNIII